MREVELPPADVPPLQRSVAAVLRRSLELDLADVPLAPATHPQPWTVWRNWLAGQGLGLVPVRAPADFNWAGPWLALLRADAAGGQVGAVAFGSPPGLAWNPVAVELTFADIEAGYVIARADVARGTFSDPHATGNDITLIEAEVLDDLALPGGGGIDPQAARRNIVTRGIDLHALVETRFTIGEVHCVGRRLCEPCAHLQRLTVPGTLRALVHRGGLRADVLSDGVIRRGDAVRPSPVAPDGLED